MLLLNFMPLIIAKCSSIHIFLHDLISQGSKATFKFSTISKHTNGAFKSCLLIIDKYIKLNWPWGIWQMTLSAPCTTTLWALPFCQFFNQRTVDPLISPLNSLFRQILYTTVSKAPPGRWLCHRSIIRWVTQGFPFVTSSWLWLMGVLFFKCLSVVSSMISINFPR